MTPSNAVAAQALGLKGLVSEDSVGRALKAMASAQLQPAQAGAPQPRAAHLAGWATCAWVADAQLSPGKEHSSGHAKAALGRLLDDLGERGPALVRGDCGFGFEAIIDVCEQRGKS